MLVIPDGKTDSTLRVQNCTFEANLGAKLGSSIYADINVAKLSVLNCTFRGNIATNGGAHF